MQKTRFDGVYYKPHRKGMELFTINLVPRNTVYGEKLVFEDGLEYRSWDATRSKLAASILKEISQTGLREGHTVLYLGASTGTTVSHVSDIVGMEGFVYALDFAPRVVRDLVFVCEKRKNTMPILADANQPRRFMHLVSKVDFVFQDIAQRNQSEIFMKNCDIFLKEGGFGFIAVKARSVDISRKPADIYRQVRSDLEKKMTIVDFRTLDPYEKDHCCFVVKKR